MSHENDEKLKQAVGDLEEVKKEFIGQAAVLRENDATIKQESVARIEALKEQVGKAHQSYEELSA